MAIGSIYPPQSQQQTGPASAQPLSIETQYRQNRLKEDLISLRQAYMAGDPTSVKMLASNITAEVSGAGLPKASVQRILQDIKNPGPAVLKADNDYMTAITDDDSVMGPITKSTYTSDDLGALNGNGASPTPSAANSPGDSNPFFATPTTPSQPGPASLNNLPQVGTAAPAA